jgi:hypothetical protein
MADLEKLQDFLQTYKPKLAVRKRPLFGRMLFEIIAVILLANLLLQVYFLPRKIEQTVKGLVVEMTLANGQKANVFLVMPLQSNNGEDNK